MKQRVAGEMEGNWGRVGLAKGRECFREKRVAQSVKCDENGEMCWIWGYEVKSCAVS